MEDVDLRHAKEHLEELIERAARGEHVAINDPKRGTFELRQVAKQEAEPSAGPPILGQWAGKLVVPARLFEPLDDEELAWLSGERSQ